MTGLFGHDSPLREWQAAIASARMHHGWLLVGPKGLGKGAFARTAARELVATPGIAQPGADSHPDIIVLEPLPENESEAKKRDEGQPYKTKRNISVDQVRGMLRRLETRPTLGDRRAIIIDPIDDLEKSAVNALLKGLEEPPTGTCFLLVAHQPGRLLPTVRSRCRVLRFDRLSGAEMDEALRRDAPHADASTRAAAIAAAHGSPATALAFVDHDLAPIHTLMQRIMRDGDVDFGLRGQLAAELGTRPDRERQMAAIDLAQATLAEGLGTAPRRHQLAIITAHGALTRLGAQVPTFNFDPGLLVMEIGGLLASAAMPREAA